MAIDLCIMPLSRYWSGNFANPTMERFHAVGSSYGVASPGGMRLIPPGEPFGGKDAPAQQRRLFEFVQREVVAPLAKRGVTETWNERSNEVRWFPRLDPDSLVALTQEVDSALAGDAAWWKRLVGLGRTPLHFTRCLIFLPCDFEEPLRVQNLEVGSLNRVGAELGMLAPSPMAESSHRSLLEAAATAERLRLPLIIDR